MREMKELNALGGILEPCSLDPLTGFFRTGSCQSGADNQGIHTVCIYATNEFLEYSKKVGNSIKDTPEYRLIGYFTRGKNCKNTPVVIASKLPVSEIMIFGER